MAVVLEASTPPRSDRAVVFAADGNYLRFASFAAAQIAALPGGRRFDICLCAPQEIAPVPGFAELRHCRVDTGGIFAALGLDRRRTEASYLRLALPAAFAGEYRRILYLDADVFVQGGDFAALMDVDIGAHPLAAVRDNMQWRTPGRLVPSYKRLGLSATPVFNSGVLLIDVAAFNEAGRPGALPRLRKEPPAGADRPGPGFPQCRAAWRLGGDLAGVELAVYLGVAPLRGDGGCACGAFHRAEEALDACRGRAAAAVPAGVPGVLCRAFPGCADRRGWGRAHGEPGLSGEKPGQASLSLRRMAAYLARFPTDLTVIR